ncbi:MAG: fumarate hydratase [Eubacteriales bacterium]|nr:fumarate hydratase [Eubacteriales bacterium]
MRTVRTADITDKVEELCISSNCILSEDIKSALNAGLDRECSPAGKQVLEQLMLNAEIALKENMPICQDTGMTVIFIDIGQEVHIEGGSMADAINEGVRRGYKKGFLRKSVVADPLFRVNTGDNTPAIIYYEIIPGDIFRITVAPKGFGSENMSAVCMLKPSDGVQGVKEFVYRTVENAGPNPCPPVIVGVGIGGTMEKAALISKKALLRPVGSKNSDRRIALLEEELLCGINKTGIGPSGLGGCITALGVNIEVYATHIAGLPVAVNIGCHATRHAEALI